MKESPFLQRVRLKFSEAGWKLFRNSTGQYTNAITHETIRYGLCKGSSDLIGWRPMTITPDMVGKRFAQFVAIEVKGKGGKLTAEQMNFLNEVEKHGGYSEALWPENLEEK